jgi:hypothetical protein
MEGFPWTFHEVTVRCPCGTCFKDADTYLQHKRSCKNHLVKTSIKSGPVGVDRKAHKPSLKASATPAPRNAGNYHGNRPTKKPHPSRNVQSSLLVRKPPTNTHSALSGFDLSVAGSTSSAAGQRSSPQCVAKIHCTCGRTFTKQESFDLHLRTSRAHQAERMHLEEEDSIPLMPSVVQLTTVNALAHLASVPDPESPLYPKILVAQLLHCDCGHSFETQRSLNLHKRDSLYHQHQAKDPSAAEKYEQDSLTSALASMTLNSGITRIHPLAANLTCICGCIFSTQAAFDQHKAYSARYAWFGD